MVWSVVSSLYWLSWWENDVVIGCCCKYCDVCSQARHHQSPINFLFVGSSLACHIRPISIVSSLVTPQNHRTTVPQYHSTTASPSPGPPSQPHTGCCSHKDIILLISVLFELMTGRRPESAETDRTDSCDTPVWKSIQSDCQGGSNDNCSNTQIMINGLHCRPYLSESGREAHSSSSSSSSPERYNCLSWPISWSESGQFYWLLTYQIAPHKPIWVQHFSDYHHIW